MFAPWCGHCKSLEPAWTAAAKDFENSSRCRIAHLDAETHRDVANRYGVKGYPTLKFVKPDGTAEDYNQARDVGSLKAFMEEQGCTALDETVRRRLDSQPSSPRLARSQRSNSRIDIFVATGRSNSRYRPHRRSILRPDRDANEPPRLRLSNCQDSHRRECRTRRLLPQGHGEIRRQRRGSPNLVGQRIGATR